MLASELGIREGELLGLQREHLDLKARVLYIRQQLQPKRGGGPTKGKPRRNGANLVLRKTKSAASRRPLLLNDRCMKALHKHIVALDALSRANPGWNPLEMLFPTPLGIPMHPSTLVHEHFHPVCALAGIAPRSTKNPKGLHFHALRHTSATRMLRDTGDIDLVRRVHGWSTNKMVERYTHLAANSRGQQKRAS